MFALNAGAAVPTAKGIRTAEGTLSRPIPIGDTDPQAFREFLWAMRARAGEIANFMNSPPSEAKALKLVSIARLAHKFQDFPMLEWVLPELHRALHSGQIYLGPKVLSEVFDLLALMDRDDANARDIVEDVRTALTRQVAHVAEHNPTTAEIPLLFIHPTSLIEIARQRGFNGILADVYYHVLLLPSDFATASTRLSNTDLKRLLAGATTLGEKWLRLRARLTQMSQLQRSHDLDAQVATKRPADLYGKLQLMRKALKHSMWPNEELKVEVDEMIATFRAGLPAIFGLDVAEE
ncbi:hypothetical protein AURDEDRAFT_112229 [Auricularia subglabra TFB-10046 SS5]|nr:hypothetical protein AURDEDRAFT_112229 [Auricularia subglabra TFB-10046 SS5]